MTRTWPGAITDDRHAVRGERLGHRVAYDRVVAGRVGLVGDLERDDRSVAVDSARHGERHRLGQLLAREHRIDSQRPEDRDHAVLRVVRDVRRLARRDVDAAHVDVDQVALFMPTRAVIVAVSLAGLGMR